MNYQDIINYFVREIGLSRVDILLVKMSVYTWKCLVAILDGYNWFGILVEFGKKTLVPELVYLNFFL